MRTKRSHEGYFQLDHTASPGNLVVPEGGMLESATLTCSHCHAIVLVHPDRTRARGYCPSCDHYVCDTCEAVRVVSGCQNLNAVLDKLQEQAFKNLNVKEL